MQTKVGVTARFKKIAAADGNRYQFFCDVSGALVYKSDPILLDTPEHEVLFAWYSGGKKQLNRCQRCGRWVTDAVYNAETLECVECSPWEEEPSYCPYCGEKVQEEAMFCAKCKNRLRYGKPCDPYEYGFGPRKMMEMKICRHCGSVEAAEKYTCSECGERLPSRTLYQIYQAKHKSCECCDTVLASYMKYCPHCGMQVREETE